MSKRTVSKRTVSIRTVSSPRILLLATAAALLVAVVAAPGTAQEPPAAEAGAPGGGGHAGLHSHAADGHGAAADPHAGHRAAAARPAAGGDAGRPVALREIPDVEVVDQDGESRRFYSDLIEGRTVAVNFVFTTCTTICPPMGANFGRLRRELGDRIGRDVHLISVSVDPVTDTPDRLRAWSEKFGAGPGWTLVTGERVQITRLLKALEVYTADINEHSPVVLIGNDAAGRWTRAHGLAPPAKLGALLSDAYASPAQVAGKELGR